MMTDRDWSAQPLRVCDWTLHFLNSNPSFYVWNGHGLDPVFGCKIFVDVVVAPPAVYLEYTKNSIQDKIKVSAQNCYKENKGAFTGETRWALACTPLAYPTTTNSHHG